MIAAILKIAGSTALIYILLLAGLRVVSKKDIGQMDITDLLFIMLIAECVGDSIRAQDNTILGTVVSVATLLLMNRLLDVLLYKYPKFRRIVNGKTFVIVSGGKLDHAELERQKITKDDVSEAARQKGLEDLSQIETAILEANGRISIIQKKKDNENR